MAERNANDRYQDFLTIGAIESLRFASGLADRFNRAMFESESEIIDRLQRFMDANGEGGVRASKTRIAALERMLREVHRLRIKSSKEAVSVMSGELREFVQDELDYNITSFEKSVGIAGVTLTPVTASSALDRGRRVTFGGRPLSTVLSGFNERDAERIVSIIRVGWLEGKPIPEIIRDMRGSSANKFRDGATSISRNDAERIARTTVSTLGNAAREQLWIANDDVIGALKWTAVLDGRTSPICRSRDGRFTPNGKRNKLPRGVLKLYPPSARPPAHPNCRSIMVPIIIHDGVLARMGFKRPFVMDTRTSRVREIDLRSLARAEGKTIQQVRAQWVKDRVGLVPEETRFTDWLAQFPAPFQDEVLGPLRGRLFRNGGLTTDSFVDRSGRRYTNEQLRARYGAAFDRAGIR